MNSPNTRSITGDMRKDKVTKEAARSRKVRAPLVTGLIPYTVKYSSTTPLHYLMVPFVSVYY